MIGTLIRLFALRPLLTMVIMGIPLLVLIAVGLATIVALKFVVFIVLPVAAVIWLVRRVRRTGDPVPTP